ncbi:prolipoprotein diacylglyceryl transferase [Nitrospira sp.]|nr:prolipoprotein diacylglyceryl transferase [Nitrospira sp.]
MTHQHALPYPDISPVIVQIGPLALRWYGLMYLIGLTVAYVLIKRRVERHQLGLTQEQVYDMVVFAALGVFLGGRLGYVLFYNLSYYLEHPVKIVAVWEGGMSFHGGLLGVIVALVVFARRVGVSVYTVADLAAAVTPVGLGFGRLGNFINGELFGRPSDVPWCMVFPSGGPVCRHPSQLYEAMLEGLVLFTVLWTINRRPTPPGTILWSFLAGYGICRVIVEFFREPDAQMGVFLGGISMGQLLSAPMILIGAIMLIVGYRRRDAIVSPLRSHRPRTPR